MNGKVGGFIRRSLMALAVVSAAPGVAHADEATGKAPFVLPARRERPAFEASPPPAPHTAPAVPSSAEQADFVESLPRLDDAEKSAKLAALNNQVRVAQAEVARQYSELQRWDTLETERSVSRVYTGLTLMISGLGVGLLGAGGVVYGETEDSSWTTPSVIVVSAAGAALITGFVLMASGG